MSYLDSPLYQQMLARTLAQGQPQSQYPTQAIGNTLAQLLNVWQMKKSVDAQDAKAKSGNEALAGLLAPENYSGPSVPSGPSQTFNLSGGGNVDMATPSIPSDVNADKRAKLAQLLNSGVITPDAVAPQILQGLGLGPAAKPITASINDRVVDPTTGRIILDAAQQYSETPQYDQSGKAFVLDKSGNMKYLDGVQARTKIDVSNGTAYDPYNTAPGTTFAPQPEAPMSPERLRQQQSLQYSGAQASAAAEAAKGDKYNSPTLIEIDDGKGGTTQITAQQDQKTGQWVTADEKRQPIAANNMRVISSANSTGGARTQVQMIRMLSAAHTIANELENVSALPGQSSAGWFGSPHSEGGNLSSIKANLTREVQPQEVQSYNTVNVGLGRALAQMEAAGLAPPGSLTAQMEGLTLQKGDTELTRLQKLATVRQTADGILDSVSNSPIATKQQKDEIAALRARYDKSIPFLPIDVINLAKAKNPGATLADVAKQRGLGASVARIQSDADYDKLPSGTVFVGPDGVQRKKP